MPAFLRPPYLLLSAVGTALVAWLVPINDGPVGSALVLLVVWLVLAYGLWALRDLASLRRDMTAGRTATPVRAPLPVPTPPAETVHDAPPNEPVERVTGAEHLFGEPERRDVRDIVALFAATGVFAPAAPRPEHLHEAAADMGAPVTQGLVLTALHEAAYYHAGFDAASCMQNLAFHQSHAEQVADALRSQIADIARLSRGALDVREISIDLRLADGPGPHPDCTVTMRVNGTPLTVIWEPDAKYLSTHLHVALAIVMRRTGSPLRLAWLWTDQGAWLSALSEPALAALNDTPVGLRSGHEFWDWIDDAEPISAGEWRATDPEGRPARD
ncbi:MAG: hypothetical protein IT355_08010 [Gemmatimonadaceae bacterium]|nr:hypothetical protein [Gemmatimonadaceae bacterium]